MGKVVKFTGSRLLGEELRRMRGGRSLKDVTQLAQSRLAVHGFRGVSTGTLSDIENGKSLPNVESIFALSVLYQIPPSRLLHFLLEESLLSQVELPGDLDQTREKLASALQSCRWTEALALAVSGLRSAVAPQQALSWRVNRALALEGLGMRSDAVAELMDCLDTPALDAMRRHLIHRELARIHAIGGRLEMAEVHARTAGRLLPATAPGLLHARALQTEAQLILARFDRGALLDETELARASSLLREARQLLPPDPTRDHAVITLLEACVLIQGGKQKEARASLTGILKSARAVGDGTTVMAALIKLAEVDAAQGRASAARASLQEAEALAVSDKIVDELFIILFRLSELAEAEEARGHYLRRCEKIYPLVQRRCREIEEFERRGSGECRS